LVTIDSYGLLTVRYCDDCGEAAVNIFFRCGPIAYADAHRRFLLPNGNAAPTSSFRLDLVDNFSVQGIVTKGHENLVQDNIIEYFETSIAKSCRKPSSMTTAAVNHLGETFFTQRF
jgi:hypothetical protein